MSKHINKLPNLFVYGMTGSGKDTVSNYLRDEYGYIKLRIAGTIKQIVMEIYGFKTQEEFENAKRTNSEIRLLHNRIGTDLDKRGVENSIKHNRASINRLQNLIDRQSFEFDIFHFMENDPLVICDVRGFDEIMLLLENGFNGIFLNRTTSEFGDKTHWTEQNLFMNGTIKALVDSKFNSQICLMFNNGDEPTEFIESFGTKEELNRLVTDGTIQPLENNIDFLINHYVKQ